MDTKNPNQIDQHVGRRIRWRRQELKLSQDALAEKLGVTFQQVQKYEKGMNRIGASRLQRASRALEVPVEFFFRDAPQFDASEQQPGFADTADNNFVADFLSTNEGIELNQAFVQIKDRKVRRRIVDLVKTVAGVEDGTKLN